MPPQRSRRSSEADAALKRFSRGEILEAPTTRGSSSRSADSLPGRAVWTISRWACSELSRVSGCATSWAGGRCIRRYPSMRTARDAGAL
ncbi:hypothetical protein ABZ654_16650 [Streptomyces hygroscopicus]|uniref:hypothetical protein n=1 Tax=Streptomyces hygroscopicus TaxID=1912 RepID=UPI0033E2EF11